MNRYFCPKCGETFDVSEGREENACLYCPDCAHSHLIWRGRVWVTFGLIIAFTALLIPVPYVPAGGVVLGGGMCLTGLFRSWQQRRARHRHRVWDESHFSNEDDFEEL